MNTWSFIHRHTDSQQHSPTGHRLARTTDTWHLILTQGRKKLVITSYEENDKMKLAPAACDSLEGKRPAAAGDTMTTSDQPCLLPPTHYHHHHL